MTNLDQTQEGSIAPTRTRAFLVVHLSDESRIIELVEGAPITFGRSRGSTVYVDHELLSRTHARVVRKGNAIEIEDLASRNGTRVNGERITGVRRLQSGDEIELGPISSIVGIESGLRRESRIISADDGELRLEGEVDRAMRYRRPMAVAMLRVPDDDRADAIGRALRPMDVLAEDIGDDYLAILPELARGEGEAALAKMVGVGRRALVVCPDDGTNAEELISQLRRLMRGEHAPRLVTDDATAIAIDPAMVRLYALVGRIADSGMTLLVLGETGSGKELVAEALHLRSQRRDKPFVKLNCAALPENLLESELFGYERGAFTGADRRKAGFFEAADGGTLFLDEIGEMPPMLQVKLLRVLERKVFTRVGGVAEVPTTARVVAATHRDLDAEVRAGRFRADLLFRIGGFTLTVPPLRDRQSEILPLAELFMKRGAVGRVAPTLSDDAKAALTAYAWPGNVRELRNAIERALVLANDQITIAELPERVRDAATRAHPAPVTNDVRGHLADIERAAIVAALDEENGNQTRAARRLGLSRRALIYKLEKYGLKTPPPTRER